MSIFGQMFLQNQESAWATDAMDSLRQRLAIRDTEIAELREQVKVLRGSLESCVCAMQDYQAGIGITKMFDVAEKAGRNALAATEPTG